MAPKNASDGPSSPVEHREKGFATFSSLRPGTWVRADKDGEKRKTEVLAIQTRRGQPQYFVHYELYNKRLDEWIPQDKIDLSMEVEWPTEKTDSKKEKTKAPLQKSDSQSQPSQPPSLKNLKRPRGALERSDSNVTGTSRPSKASGKENKEDSVAAAPTPPSLPDETPAPDEADDQSNWVDVQDAAAAAERAPNEAVSREDEIEKLRQGGSMTQNQGELSRVRNLSRIQMGQHEIEPWYFSPYPQEFADADIVYICEFCLEYFPALKPFERHRRKCMLSHPPGNEIYRDDKYSFFEIDGRRQRTWCRNLCLLSKLFLDHKTLYYDVDPFLFYCMAERDASGCHLVGYFSKEKESAEGFNVACILTLPQHQRRGLGRLLIAFSYELSKREGKKGSPEKPLSDLGLLGYRAFWSENIMDLVLGEGEFTGCGKRENISIEEIEHTLCMCQSDVLHALYHMHALRLYRHQHIVLLTEPIFEMHRRKQEKQKITPRHKIQPERLIWKPPVFTAASRTWNW